MIAWITENMATIIISAILVMAVAAILVSMIRGKKKGKSACGCGCGSCPAGSSCAVNDSRNSKK